MAVKEINVALINFQYHDKRKLESVTLALWSLNKNILTQNKYQVLNSAQILSTY